MPNIFALILLICVLITGIITILDKLPWTSIYTNNLIRKNTKTAWGITNSIAIFPYIAIVLIIRSFICEPFHIPSGSMMPTLLTGDLIAVQKYTYSIKDPLWNTQLIKTGKPHRGDIVVFKYPVQPNIYYVKRVIGMPGDTIRYSKNKKIYIKKKLSKYYEPIPWSNIKHSKYKNDNISLIQLCEHLGNINHNILINPLQNNDTYNYYFQHYICEWVIPKDKYFMMGDNRDNSLDSRYWGFVPEQNLIGKVLGVWLSFSFNNNSTDSSLPRWIPTKIRFKHIGFVH